MYGLQDYEKKHEKKCLRLNVEFLDFKAIKIRILHCVVLCKVFNTAITVSDIRLAVYGFQNMRNFDTVDRTDFFSFLKNPGFIGFFIKGRFFFGAFLAAATVIVGQYGLRMVKVVKASVMRLLMSSTSSSVVVHKSFCRLLTQVKSV